MNKKLLIGLLVVLAVVFFFPKSYISGPGFVMPEQMAEFEANREHCFGFSYLTNAEEAAADAPGKSLCFGWLYRSSQQVEQQENVVGGDRDERGCLGSAGYQWCEEKQKCLRTFEESCADTAL